MEKPQRNTSRTYWAWGISLAVHMVLLTLFGVFTFQARQDAAAVDPVSFTVEQIQEIVKTEPITVKPKMKPFVSSQSIDPKLATNSVELETLDSEFPVDETNSDFSFNQSHSSVEFFGHRSRARKICYVVDCSGSMFGRMGLVRNQLRSSIDALRADQFFSILFFHKEGQILQSGDGFLRRVRSSTRGQAYSMIDSIQPEGKTEALSALRMAMKLREPSGSPVEVIYFLTDGFDLEDTTGLDFAEQVENMRKTLAPQAVIHTIGFWIAPEDQWILQMIAEKSGGGFISIE